MSDKIVLSRFIKDHGGAWACMTVEAEILDSGKPFVNIEYEVGDGPSGISATVIEHGVSAKDLLDKASALQQAAIKLMDMEGL